MAQSNVGLVVTAGLLLTDLRRLILSMSAFDDRLASPFRGKPATTTSRPDNSAVSSASSTRLDRTHQSPNYSHPQQHQQRAPGMPTTRDPSLLYQQTPVVDV